MEFSPQVVRGERILLAAFLAVLGAAMWLESRSELSAAIRNGEPWLCWIAFVELGGTVDDNYLAIFQTDKRSLDLVEFGAYETALSHKKVPPGNDLPEVPMAKDLKNPTAPYLVRKVSGWSSEEDALAARDWLAASTQGLGLWRWWARRLLGKERVEATPGLPFFDQVLLSVELHRLDPRAVHSAWLPLDQTDRRVLYGRILSHEGWQSSGAPTVELLNATDQAGVANAAKDVLRLQGVDVVNIGNWSGPALGRTVVYDRTGRVADAEGVRDRLGCADAVVVTKIAPKKLVDVTVVLAEDCAAPGRRGDSWNLSRY